MKYKIRQWLRDLLGIDADLQALSKNFSANAQVMRDQIKAATQVIKERTTISADIGYSKHNENWIIVVGRYKGRDYVQAFGAHAEDFEGMCHQLKEMERYGRLDKVDAPPMFRAVYETFRK